MNLLITPLILLLLLVQVAIGAEDANLSTENPPNDDKNMEALPEEWQSMFRQAVELRDNGKLYEAIAEFKSLLALQPTLHRARLELAVAYYRAARYEQALKEAEDVLFDPNTPREVKKTIRYFMETINQTVLAENNIRNDYSGSLSINLGFDDNASVGPETETFLINGGTLTIDPESLAQEDNFYAIQARIGHNYRFKGSVPVGAKPAQLLWQSSANLYHKGYEKLTDYSVQIASISTGPALVSRSNWRTGLSMQLDYLRLGYSDLAFYYGVTPYYTFVKGKTDYSVRAQWQSASFFNEEDKDRNGDRIGAGFDLAHRIGQRTNVQAGVGFYQQGAEVEKQKYDISEIFLGGIIVPTNRWNFLLRGYYRELEYKGEEPLFDIARSDEQLRIFGSVAYNFGNESFFQKWSVGLKGSYTDNSSNIEIYTYDRMEILLDFTRQF